MQKRKKKIVFKDTEKVSNNCTRICKMADSQMNDKIYHEKVKKIYTCRKKIDKANHANQNIILK